MKLVCRFSPFVPSCLLFLALAGGFQARAAAAEAAPLSGSGGPTIWLQENQSVPVTHVGTVSSSAGKASSAKTTTRNMAAGQATPISMAKGDFDQDGVEDLVVGYATATGGSVVLHRGNLDAFAPQSDASFRAIGEGRFPAPFLKKAFVFDIPIRPDFVAAGKFTGKNFQDLVVGSRGGSSLYVFAGDGTGKFADPVIVNLPGALTAVASGEFGAEQKFTQLIVGLNGPQRTFSLAIFGGSETGLRLEASVRAAASVSVVELGELDGDFSPDAAIVAGEQVFLLHGATMKLQKISLPVSAASLLLGTFLKDHSGPRQQIAILASDGSVHIVAHDTFDPRAYSTEEIRAIREAAPRGARNPLLTHIAGSPNEDWRIVESFPSVAPFANDVVPVVLRGRVSSSGLDDVMVLNSFTGKMVMISHARQPLGASTFIPGEVSTRPYSGSPVGAVSMRVNVDGRPGFVVLHQGQVAPLVAMPLPDPTFFVNRTDDPAPGTNSSNCNNISNADTSTSCSLRQAVIKANTSPGADTIMVPAGTFTLTIPGADENAALTGDLDITDGVTIVGAVDGQGKPATIIQAGSTSSNGIDKVFSVNPNLDKAFDTSFTNLTIRFGKNSSSFSGDGFGGGFDWEAYGTGNLTLTNCLITNNSTTDGDGGGITATNTGGGPGVFTITNSTIQNNVAQQAGVGSAFGGGIYLGMQTRMVITNTKILSNQVIGPIGEGGGVFAFGPGTTPATSIHGGAITGNQSSLRGGGISTTAGMRIDQLAVISNNQSGTGAGLYSNVLNETTTLANVTVTGNIATSAGGGIAVDTETTANNLRMSYSRLAGNSAPVGMGSNFSNISGTVIAQNNWWGTNTPASTINGTITSDPFITLTNVASPSLLKIGDSSLITASFAQDNHGTAILPINLAVLIGLPAPAVLFPDTPSFGVLSGVQAIIQANGTATETFNSTAGGNEVIHAVADASVPLTVTVLFPPTISASFGAATIAVNAITSLSFTVTNPNLGNAMNGVAFTNTLPAGLVLATPNGITGSCGGGTITAVAGSSSLSLTGATLAQNTACTFSVNVKGTTDGVDSDTTGVVSSTNAGPGNTASATITVINPPTITGVFGASSIPLSGTATLTFTIASTNTTLILSGVSFTDNLPAGLVVATPSNLNSTCTGSLAAVNGASAVSLTTGIIAPAGSCTISVNVTGTTAGVKNNSVQVASTNAGTGNTSSASITVVAPLMLSEAFGAASIPLNGSTSLTFNLSNPNSVASASGIGFVNALPAGLVVSATPGVTGACGTGTITAIAGSSAVSLSGGTLAASGSCSFSVNVTGIAAGTKNDTTGAITSTEGGTGGIASASLTVVAPPSIAKAFAAASISLNGTTSLTFTITNPVANTSALTGVAFTDTFPVGMLVATPNGLAGTCAGTITSVAGSNSVTLVGAGLPVSGSCTFSVNVSGAASGNFTNTTGAVTSTNGGTGNTATANLSVASPPSIVKTFAAASIPLNGSTSLSFTITNPAANAIALAGVAFTDALPAGLIVGTPNALTGSCGGGTVTSAPGSSSVSLAGATLAASGSCTFSLNVTGTTAGVKNNSVAVSSTNAGNGNTSNASVTVVTPPTISKSFGVASLALNSSTTLTFNLNNPNPATSLSGVAFTDALPAGMTVSTPSGLTGSCGGGTILSSSGSGSVGLSAATLPASASCTFIVNVTATSAGAKNNTTGAVTSTEGGAGGSATASLTVNQAIPVITWATPAAIAYGTALSGTQLNASASVAGTFAYTPAAGAVFTVGLQTLNVTFTPTDTANYATATASVTQTVNKATPVLTWAQPVAIGFGTSLSNTQLNATASVAGTFAYTPAAGAVLPVGSQTLNVTFTPTDAANYTAAISSVALTVNNATPVITWAQPVAITYGTALSATQLNAAASVPGTFTYTPAAGALLTAGTQTLNISFTPTDTANYSTATSSVTLVVNKATPAITWTTPAAIAYGTALSPTQLNATSSVLGTFLYAPAAGAVLLAGPQTLSVTLTPTDATNYATATSSVTLNVNKGAPVIAWAQPASIPYGTALGATQLNATATVSGTFAYTPAAGTVLAAGSQMLNVTFTPTDGANYTTASLSVTLMVNKATPAITWAQPAAIVFGTALSGAQLDASSSVAGSSVYSPAAGTILPAGLQTLNVTFTPTDGFNYTTATSSVTIRVSKATPAITWAQPAAITYGTTLGASQLNAAASVPGTFVYTPAAGTVLIGGTQTLNVTFTPMDTTTYSTATASVNLLVNPAAALITWAQPAAISYGTALGSGQLNATANVAGTFIYSPAIGAVLAAGVQTLHVTFAPTDTVSYASATSSVSLTVNQAVLTAIADNKARAYGASNPSLTFSITGFVNGDSSSVASGAPVLSTTAIAISQLGSYPISITGGSLAATNYSFKLVAGALTITGVPLTVKANDATKVYGAPAPAFTGTVTGAVNGDTFTETFTTNAVVLSATGAYTVTPAVAGSNLADYSVTAMNGMLTVTKAPSITAVTTSGSPSLSGASVVFTAAVASGTTGVPTGVVTFSEGTSSLATVSLVAGSAAYASSSLSGGPHTITATYTGDGNFTGSTSGAVTQVINSVFTLSDTPGSVTVNRGQGGQVAVIVTPGAGFSGNVLLSCTNLPGDASCLFSPTEVLFGNGGGAQTVSLVVYAHRLKTLASAERNNGGALPTIPALAFWLPGAALSGFGLRRKRSARQRQMLLLAILALGLGGMIGITGCGSGTGPSTAPGTYTIHVVGTSGAQQQMVPVTVTVK